MSAAGRPRSRQSAKPFDVKLTVMMTANDRAMLARLAETEDVTDSEMVRRLIRRSSRNHNA